MTGDRFGIGVFLPVANGGWIVSSNSPVVDGSYALNRRAALNAERLGFDYVVGMAKWRGYGGPTQHWDRSIESLTMCSGIADATSTIDVICTIHTSVFNPVALAKMLATFDHIAGGRAGVNIVCGSHAREIAQMGIVQPDHDALYDMGREWITIMKRLWAENRIDSFQGDYFQVEDVASAPGPMRIVNGQRRPLLMCAGSSDVGLKYATEETDICLTSGNRPELMIENGQRTKRIAAELGRTTQTIALLTIVPGTTDEHAESRLQLFNEGADVEALTTLANVTKRARSVAPPPARNAAFRMAGFPVVGGPESLANQLKYLLTEGQYEGAVLTFPDFDADLEFFGEHVIPLLRDRGLMRPTDSRFKLRQAPAAVAV